MFANITRFNFPITRATTIPIWMVRAGFIYRIVLCRRATTRTIIKTRLTSQTTSVSIKLTPAIIAVECLSGQFSFAIAFNITVKPLLSTLFSPGDSPLAFQKFFVTVITCNNNFIVLFFLRPTSNFYTWGRLLVCLYFWGTIHVCSAYTPA